MIKKVAVLGAGMMGSGIAAQIANAGCQVLLLDIASSEHARNLIVNNALTKITSDNKLLADASLKDLITIGNYQDDLAKIADCDWIIEVIVEDVVIKKQLYQTIIPHISAKAFLSSNTSTYQLKQLVSDLPTSLKKRFCITHFFNPPRFMRLVEFIHGDIDYGDYKNLVNFITHRLGKNIVRCNDSPGFIANRVGCFLLELALKKASKYKVKINIIDEIFNQLFGFPRTGIFGLYDLIGLDVMKMISQSLVKALPSTDLYAQLYEPIEKINELINNGFIGKKGKGGFYILNKVDENSHKLALDLDTWQYTEIDNNSNIIDKLTLFNGSDETSFCLQEILITFGIYVCALIPEIASQPAEIDQAMRLGYNWRYGPFALINQFSANPRSLLIDGAQKYKLSLPAFILDEANWQGNKVIIEQPTTMLSIKYNNEPKTILSNNAAQLNVSNDILCFKMLTKMNILNTEVFALLEKSIEYAEASLLPIIIYNDCSNFSLGADLKTILQYINEDDYSALSNMLESGQRVMCKLKYAKVPIIACVRNMALGGGFELLLASGNIIANLETHAGMVEVGVGLIPSWGGVTACIMGAAGDHKVLEHNLKKILLQTKTNSAYQLQNSIGNSENIKQNFINIKINMNADFLYDEAVEWAKQLAISSMSHKIKQTSNKVIKNFKFDPELFKTLQDEHTIYIASKLQESINEYEHDEQSLLKMERNLFIEFSKMPATKYKIKQALKMS